MIDCLVQKVVVFKDCLILVQRTYYPPTLLLCNVRSPVASARS